MSVSSQNPVWLNKWLAETEGESRERLSAEEQALADQREVEAEAYVENVLDSVLLCSLFLGSAAMAVMRFQGT